MLCQCKAAGTGDHGADGEVAQDALGLFDKRKQRAADIRVMALIIGK